MDDSSRILNPSPFRKIFKTLRFRLAVWNAIVVVIAAMLSLVGLRVGVQKIELREIDQSLQDDAREIVLELTNPYAMDVELLRQELERKAQGHSPGAWYVRLLDKNGQVVAINSVRLAAETAPPKSGEKGAESTAGYRQLRQSVEVEDEKKAKRTILPDVKTIELGATLRDVEEDVARVDHLTLLAAGVMLLAAPLCGYWLAGRASGAIGGIIDAAARLRPSHLEERLPIRGTGDELDQLAQTINRLLDRIATYINTKRDFLANAAHELRTPLAAIHSSVEVALGGDRKPEEYEDLMVDIIDECNSLEIIVNQLLLLSETEADLPMAKFQRVDLKQLTEKSVDMFNGVADVQGVDLRMGSIEEASVAGNPNHLRQLLNNLLDNAVKYTPVGGRILVDLTIDREARRARLQICDNGPGISPQDQRHIYERFYRAESSRSRSGVASGTGLGLSICQSVVHNHGGEIECKSELDNGTTFIVSLPLVEGTPSGPATPRGEAAERPRLIPS